MTKRKHVKKNPVVVLSDANQQTKNNLKEKIRLATAAQKRIEKMREEYLEELRVRKELADGGALKYMKNAPQKPSEDSANE